MLFNSPSFLFVFLPVTLAAYVLAGLAGRRGLPSVVLIVASLTFYGWEDPARLLPIIATSIVANYCFGLLLLKKRSFPVLSVAVCLNLGGLFYFKYAMFAVHAINAMGIQARIDAIVLPIGISFYTFTQIAYLVDTFRGQVKDPSFINYALFVSYFPHLVAGPILHHAEVMPQFADRRLQAFDLDRFAGGSAWFAIGLFKKVVLADGISPYADAGFAAASGGSPPLPLDAWIGAVSYTFQLYFDFSGYSDMAIGLALMMNIRFPINFFSPYQAGSLIEFWHRWHMTLSRFLRDYLYIPLGGNRRGVPRRYANLFATMLLGGLWHGASWTFVLWGAIHGLGLLANHAFRSLTARRGPRMPKPLGQMLTLLVVILAWVPFRAPDLATTWTLWASMAGTGAAASSVIPNPGLAAAWLFGLACIALLMPNTAQIFRAVERGGASRIRWSPSPGWALACGTALGMAIALSLTHPSAFLYFRF